MGVGRPDANDNSVTACFVVLSLAGHRSVSPRYYRIGVGKNCGIKVLILDISRENWLVKNKG